MRLGGSEEPTVNYSLWFNLDYDNNIKGCNGSHLAVSSLSLLISLVRPGLGNVSIVD